MVMFERNTWIQIQMPIHFNSIHSTRNFIPGMMPEQFENRAETAHNLTDSLTGCEGQQRYFEWKENDCSELLSTKGKSQ